MGETCNQYAIWNKGNYTLVQYDFSESILVAENVFIIMSKGIFYGFQGNVLIILISK